MDRTIQSNKHEQVEEGYLVEVSKNAVNPKVPVAALGAVELGQLVGWLAEVVGVSMPTHISAILGGILAWVIAAYLIPHRID